MKHLILLLSVLLLTSCGSEKTQTETATEIALVESTPVETPLGLDAFKSTRSTWLDMIGAAEKSLDIAQFYFANMEGEALDGVIEAVLAAAKRGVRVRVLAEKKFYDLYPETVDIFRRENGITVHIYDISGINGRGVLHAKYFVVDDKSVFVGSQNWDWRSLTQINELGVAITDIAIATAFTTVFNFDWQLAENRGLEEASRSAGRITGKFPVVIEDDLGRHEITPVFSPRDLLPMGAEWDETAIKKLIAGAQDSISIQVLSYHSYPPIGDVLLAAAERGVQVHMLVSDWSLHPDQQEDLKYLQGIPNISVRFTAIPDASGGFISYARVEHCKYILVDTDRAWIGTSNWSRDYFHSSRNAGIILRSAGLVGLLHEKFQQSWNGPYAQDLDPAKKYEVRKNDDGSGT
ncbi:hypothetical protein KQI65_02905 [bacterium]|nr:hypothetical protein [bacterium]